jgi:hypothetical protein
MRVLLKPMRATRFFVIASVLVVSLTLAAGCENAVDISGIVVVPVDVQQLFSAEHPGAVAIWRSPGSGSDSLRYLCAPQEEALTLPYRIVAFGCEEEGLIEARAFRVAPTRLSQVHCDQPDIVSTDGALLGEELGYGAATIFKDHHGGPCTSGSTSADVTIAVGAGPTN